MDLDATPGGLWVVTLGKHFVFRAKQPAADSKGDIKHGVIMKMIKVYYMQLIFAIRLLIILCYFSKDGLGK